MPKNLIVYQSVNHSRDHQLVYPVCASIKIKNNFVFIFLLYDWYYGIILQILHIFLLKMVRNWSHSDIHLQAEFLLPYRSFHVNYAMKLVWRCCAGFLRWIFLFFIDLFQVSFHGFADLLKIPVKKSYFLLLLFKIVL